ncbi:MAG: hypothetical protein MN733_28595 [Nitrososphaera sp.]|nr:hypothetical protein [Nitrososphaera sp.]
MIEHLVRCLENGAPHRWHVALEKNFRYVIDTSMRQITKACEVTGLDENALFQKIGFTVNDLSVENLDAAIATVRGIYYLVIEGFNQITVLKPQKGIRTADLVAIRCGTKFALDVACSNAGTDRALEDLSRYMLGVATAKQEQLDNTVAANNCTHRGLVFVINSGPVLYFGGDHLSYRETITSVIQTLGNPPAYHMCILTGSTSQVFGFEGDGPFEGPNVLISEGKGDVVYPPWPDCPES